MLGLLAGLIRGHRARLLIFALLCGLAVAAAAAIPAWTRAAADGTTALALADTTGASRSVRFTGVLGNDPAALITAAGDAAGLLPANRFSRYSSFSAGVTGTYAGSSTTFGLGFVEGGCARLAVQGTCATGADEIMLTPATAARFGVAPGDAIVVQGGPVAGVPLTVTGVYRAADPAEEFWTARTAPGVALDAGALLGDPAGFQLISTGIVNVTHDFVLRTDVPFDERAVRGDLAALTPARVAQLILNTRLAVLLDSLRGNEAALFRGGAIAAGQLGLISGFVLLLAAAQLAAERRDEAALAALRGAPAGSRALIAVAPGLITIPVAAPAGFLLGYGLAALAARAEFGVAPPAGASLIWAGVATLGCVAVVVAAAVVHRPRGPVLEGLRRTPSRLRIRPLDAITLIVVALAAAAWYEIDSAGAADAEGVALLGPALFALAGGLLTARLVPPLAARAAAHRLQAGRLGSGLAALQLARRPGGHRILALFAVTVALLAQAVTAADLGARAARDRARWEVGADRVLAVRAENSQALRAAVHAADPEGRWAMPVVRSRQGGAPLVAIEPDRLAAVVARPDGFDVGRLRAETGALYAESNPVVRVDGTALVLDLDVDLSLAEDITVHLVDDAGARITARMAAPSTIGPATLRAPLSGCAAGCRLSFLGFSPRPDGLRLRELRQEGPDRVVLTGADLGAPGRWRPGFSLGTDQVRIHQEGSWLAADYRAPDFRNVAVEVRLRLTDTPVPVPVIAALPEREVQADGARQVLGFDLRARPITMAGGMAALPGIPRGGFMIDFEYAVRLLEDAELNAAYEVWLAPGAPAGLRDGLRAAGLEIAGETTIAARAAQLAAQGPGQATRLYLAAAGCGLLLALVGTALVVAVERRRRAGDLMALRAQGMSAPAVGIASRGDRLALVLAGVAAGALLGWLSWAVHHDLLPVFADGAEPTVPALPFWAAAATIAATLTLAAVALRRDTPAAGRRTPVSGRQGPVTSTNMPAGGRDAPDASAPATGAGALPSDRDAAGTGGTEPWTGRDEAGVGGDRSTTGADATATGPAATATGGDVTATGGDATATGGDATATGRDATATGGDAADRREERA